MEQTYTPKQDYKALCYCITYNQAKVIEDTLNGFSMQKTDFPFVCLVVEDCSTDGEQDVIKAWLERECDMTKADYIDLELSNVILVPHKTNENCTFAIYLLKTNLWKEQILKETLITPWREHCEYEAFCEGDDYWIFKEKLKQQVAYLDEHPEISYSCSRYNVLEDDTNNEYLASNYFFDKKKNTDKKFYVFTRGTAFSKGWITKTPTSVIRTSIYKNGIQKKLKSARDVYVVYDALSVGDGVCHSFVGSVYRLNNNSTYGGKGLIEQRLQNFQVYDNLYRITNDIFILRIASICYFFIIKENHGDKKPFRMTYLLFLCIVELPLLILKSLKIACSKFLEAK